jgi:glutaconate CoA-transferase subunit A
MTSKLATFEEAAALVADGDRIGFGGSAGLWRRPVEFARELVRAGRSGLHAFGVLNGLEVDLLVGAGAVASTNTSYVGLDEFGQAPNFQQAATTGTIDAREYTEWMITAALRASNMSLSFLPWRTGQHSDIAADLELKRVECPYTGSSYLAIPAADVDVAVIQATRADAAGNTEVGIPLDFIYDVDALIARAAKRVIVCAEEIGPVDPTRIQLLGREVDAVVEAPSGAWPCGMSPLYGVDRAHLLDVYLPAARAGEFSGYLDEFVRATAARR